MELCVDVIKRQKKESDIYYYADGGHSTHNTRPLMHGSRRANVWSSPLWAVGTQVNINRLLNAHDVTDVIAHMTCSSVNADSTIGLYKAALKKYLEAESIYILTDNARYYYYLSKKLRKWLEGTKIKQVFLPPYSPKLNLIGAAVEVLPKGDHQHEVLSDKT